MHIIIYIFTPTKNAESTWRIHNAQKLSMAQNLRILVVVLVAAVAVAAGVAIVAVVVALVFAFAPRVIGCYHSL